MLLTGWPTLLIFSAAVSLLVKSFAHFGGKPVASRGVGLVLLHECTIKPPSGHRVCLYCIVLSEVDRICHCHDFCYESVVPSERRHS
jgi:hypothetical protein